jgi:hypothetical protein
MNTKIFATAARHALIDMTMFDILGVSDKVGVSTYLEEASDEKILQLLEAVLHSETEFHSKQLLESNYIESIKGNGIINEIIWNDGRNNILMEAEGGEESGKKLDPEALLKVFKQAGVAGTAVYWVHVITKYGPAEGERQLRNAELSGVMGIERVRAAVNRITSLAYKASKKGYKNTVGPKKGFGEDTKEWQKYKEELQKQAAKLGKMKGKDVSVNQLKSIDREAQQLAKLRSKAMFEPVKKLVSKVGSDIRSNAPKVAIGGAIIGGAIFGGHYIWQKFVSSAAKSCSKFKLGKQKDICILKFKISAADAAIKKVQSDLPKCAQHQNPEKCTHALQTEIWNWNRRKHNYMSRLAKLTGSQKPPEDASGGSDIFKARTSTI